MAITNTADQQTLKDLSTAMMLLEMHSTNMFSEPDEVRTLIWASQSIIQNIAARMQGRPATQLDLINETLTKVWTKVAIADATGPTSAGVRDVSK